MALAPWQCHGMRRIARAACRSSPLSFRTLPAVGDRSPVRIGIFGDLGQTRYSRQTLERLATAEPRIIFNMGGRCCRIPASVAVVYAGQDMGRLA